MIIYFAIFVVGLISSIVAVQIVFLTKKNLDRSYRFFMFAAMILSLGALLKILAEINFGVNESVIKYFDLIFAFLFLDGLILMRRVIKNLK